MSTESAGPLTKITIRISSTDLDYLKVAYAATGYNKIIRALVRQHVRALENLTIENLADTKLTTEELNV